VVRRRRRLRALAVAAQVRRDDGEALCETGCDRVPHHVRLRVPVEQEERRPGTAPANAQLDALEVDPLEREAGEELGGHARILCDKIAVG